MRGRLSGSQPSRIVSYQRHAALKVAATGPAWRALCMGRGPAAGIWVHVLILCRPGLRSNLAHGAEPSRQIALIYEDLLSPTGCACGIAFRLARGPCRVVHAALRRAGVSEQALYDLAGIAARVPDGTAIALTPAEADAVIARHCASPYFWDPLGDDAHCGETMARLRSLPVSPAPGRPWRRRDVRWPRPTTSCRLPFHR